MGLKGNEGWRCLGSRDLGQQGGGLVFQIGLCEEQKHLEIDCEGDALYRHSYHHSRNHKQ